MLTNFVFCIPLKNKSASEIVTAWRNHIAFPFGVSRKMLMDNGTEFKNSLFSEVAKELGLERKIYSPPYRPQSNGVLEGFHKFLKASFAKHISRHKEWDDVAAMAAASYNYMPNQHSKEAPFFVMFGRDAVTNIGHIMVPRYRYMGTEDLILNLEIMSNIYQCQIINLQLARHHALKLKVGDTQPSLKTDLAVGDLVLVRDHASKTFMPKYKVDFRIVRILGNKVEVKDNHGKLLFGKFLLFPLNFGPLAVKTIAFFEISSVFIIKPSVDHTSYKYCVLCMVKHIYFHYSAHILAHWS